MSITKNYYACIGFNGNFFALSADTSDQGNIINFIPFFNAGEGADGGSDINKLGNKYKQDSVLFADGETKAKGQAIYISANGSETNIGKFTPDKISQGFSKMKGGKVFTFLEPGDKGETPKEKPKKEEPKEVTSNDLKRQDNIDKLFERQEKRLAELKQDFKDEIFTKEEYLERIKSIEEQTNLALSKFGEGGKV
jgi:hypothetical protein